MPSYYFLLIFQIQYENDIHKAFGVHSFGRKLPKNVHVGLDKSKNLRLWNHPSKINPILAKSFI